MKVKFILFSILFFITNLAIAHDILEDILEDHHDVQTALASDLFVDAQSAAKLLQKDTEHWLSDTSPTDPRRSAILQILDGAKGILVFKPDQVQEIRDQFEKVANGLIELVRKVSPLKADWVLFYCPMVKKYWAQPKTDAKMMNPYMGKKMQQCGTKKPW